MQPPAHRLTSTRLSSHLLNRLWIIWAAIFYSSLGISTLLALIAAPANWPRIGLILSLALFSILLFQRQFLPNARRSNWPLNPRSALIYFAGQGLIFAGLSSLGGSFIALGFAVMGQAVGSLPLKQWALPLGIGFSLIGWQVGIIGDLRRGEWGNIFGFVMSATIFVIISVLIYRLFEQRYALLDLVEELRQAQAELRANQAQQEELATLRERTRLARDMHDTLGHALVLIAVKLEAAQRLYQRDAQRGAGELEATRALVRETMTNLRQSLVDLRAPIAAHRDLPSALRRLAAESSLRSGLHIEVSGSQVAVVPEAIGAALLQIASEAVHNIERHAAATRASLHFERTPTHWRLQISDNGRGIDPVALQQPGHFGVIGMRERAAAHGGSLEISGAALGGACISAIIPDLPQGGEPWNNQSAL